MMNSVKLRQIVLQATTWCENNAIGTPVAWEWEAKFAELIVKECLRVIDKTADDEKNNWMGDEPPSSSYVFAIKKEFGV